MAQLKDLIVTGAARFLNTIYGNLEGNAATATLAETANKTKASLTIGQTSFNGADSTIIEANDIKSIRELNTISRLVGTVDTNFPILDNIENTYIAQDGNRDKPVVAISTFYDPTINYFKATLNGIDDVKFYTPSVGDIVIDISNENVEYLCIEQTANYTKWIRLGTNTYWGTWE